MSGKGQIKLQSGGESGDSQTFTIEREIAEMSGTIKNILEGFFFFFCLLSFEKYDCSVWWWERVGWVWDLSVSPSEKNKQYL